MPLPLLAESQPIVWTPTEVITAIVIGVYAIASAVEKVIWAMRGDPTANRTVTGVQDQLRDLQGRLTDLSQQALPPHVQQQLLSVAARLTPPGAAKPPGQPPPVVATPRPPQSISSLQSFQPPST